MGYSNKQVVSNVVAQDILQLHTSLSSVLTENEKQAVVAFFNELLLTEDTFAKLLEVYLFVGGNLNGVLTKAKTITGKQPSLNNFNFVYGDYAPAVGLTPDGTSKYVRTGVNVSLVGKESGGMVLALTDDLTDFTADRVICGKFFANPAYGIITRASDTSLTCYYHALTHFPLVPPDGIINKGNLIKFQRRTDTDMSSYLNENLIINKTNPVSDTGNTTEWAVFGNASGTQLFNKPIGIIVIENGMLSTEQSIRLDRAVNRYLGMMGRKNKISSYPLKYRIGYGQSLSLGATGTPALSTTPQYTNSMFGNAPAYSSGIVQSGMKNGSTNEIPIVPFCNYLSYLYRTLVNNDEKYDSFANGFGVAGQNYNALKQGTASYTALLNFFTKVQNIADVSHNRSIEASIQMFHGEADANSATYYADSIQWYTDLNTDIKAITLQSEDIYWYQSQISSWTSGSGIAVAKSPYATLLSGVDGVKPRMVCVCAKYIFPYTDTEHLTNIGYRWVAQFYGIAAFETEVLGKKFFPLYPKSATRTGAVIDVIYHVPDGELSLDTSVVSNPGNYGFEYYDTTSSATISSVVILNDYSLTNKTQTVRVTLNTTPTGGSKEIRYAYTGIAFNLPGVTTGPRGCLKSANTKYTSPYGDVLDHYAVHSNTSII